MKYDDKVKAKVETVPLHSYLQLYNVGGLQHQIQQIILQCFQMFGALCMYNHDEKHTVSPRFDFDARKWEVTIDGMFIPKYKKILMIRNQNIEILMFSIETEQYLIHPVYFYSTSINLRFNTFIICS